MSELHATLTESQEMAERIAAASALARTSRMIARHEDPMGKQDIWTALSAPIAKDRIAWRKDGKVHTRDGKHIARFVCYIEAGTVRDRLDSVVAGEWDLTLDLLPQAGDRDGELMFAFKGRLQILGVIREDVGMGADYKSAATDAFKRAAVRFGIGHELYDMEQLWLQVDGDGAYAKPLEDPQTAYDARFNRPDGVTKAAADLNERDMSQAVARRERESAAATPTSTARPSDATQACPKCGGPTWDNRTTKRNPRAPDYKCRNRSCDGAIWPPRDDAPRAAASANDDRMPAALGPDDDDLPF